MTVAMLIYNVVIAAKFLEDNKKILWIKNDCDILS